MNSISSSSGLISLVTKTRELSITDILVITSDGVPANFKSNNLISGTSLSVSESSEQEVNNPNTKVKANNLNNLKFLEFKKYPTDAVNVNPNRTEAKLEFPTVKTITPANSGCFLAWDGKSIPW